MLGFDRLITAVTTVVPGPGGTITFIRQARGPYAGSWLLPGGKIEFGESLADAARREVREESGCLVDQVEMLGLYEIRGTWTGGEYHILMCGFVSHDIGTIPDGFTGHHVDDVQQTAPAALPTHPAVMQILADAGLIETSQHHIDAALATAGIYLERHLTDVVSRAALASRAS